MEPLRLCSGQPAREIPPLLQVRALSVASDHPGEPPGTPHDRLLAAVRGGMLVGALGQLPGQPIDVGRRGEPFRDERHARSPEGHRLGHRHHRRPDHSGVDQLARDQPRGIVPAARLDPAPANRDQIGGGAAHIHEQRVGLERRDHRGGGQPVGRCHPERGVDGFIGGAEAGAAIEEPEMPGAAALLHLRHQRAHTLGASREEVRHLSGHRDRVHVGRPQFGEGEVQRGVQLGQAAPEGTGKLRHTLHPSSRSETRRLDVRPAEVPTDHAVRRHIRAGVRALRPSPTRGAGREAHPSAGARAPSPPRSGPAPLAGRNTRS